MKSTNTYTVKQIAAITGFSSVTVYDKIRTLRLSPESTKKGLNYYNENSFRLIIKLFETSQKEKSFTKYYPMKTIETYYIYESKMNLN